MGFSIINRKEEFVKSDDSIFNQDFIEIDIESDYYASEHSNTAEFDCDKMMETVFQKLYDEKRIIERLSKFFKFLLGVAFFISHNHQWASSIKLKTYHSRTYIRNWMLLSKNVPETPYS